MLCPQQIPEETELGILSMGPAMCACQSSAHRQAERPGELVCMESWSVWTAGGAAQVQEPGGAELKTF